MFGHRPDAKLAEGLPPIRRFMQFVSPRRNDSLVYFSQDVDVEPALAFVERVNADREPADRVTLFHLVLRSITKVLDERPRLNRFTAGGRVWQRDGIWISFSAKMAFDDDAPILTVKRRFDPKDSLLAMVDGLHASLREGRSGKKTTSDTEMGLLLRLPPFVTRFLMRIVRWADEAGLLPKAMIEPDPMHASVFVANLGSVGLDAGYHHLWEYGNIPIFCVIGQIHGEPGARRVTLKWTYDERVEDGLYCARSLERLKGLLAVPEAL